MIQLTPDLRLLWAPFATYRQIRTESADARASWRVLLVRIFTAPVIAGIAAGVSATNRVSWSLFLSGLVCWSFVCAVQCLNAFLLIGRHGKEIGYLRALELFFHGHAAWSLWLIASGLYLFAVPEPARREHLLLLTTVVPIAWTFVITVSYAREVLHLNDQQAIVRAIVHQSLSVLTIALYVIWAVQLWPRILSFDLQ